MDYLQIEKYRLYILFFRGFSFLFTPEMSAPLQPACLHTVTQTRTSHIVDMARTIKAVLRTFAHGWENKSKSKKEKKKKRFTSKKNKQKKNIEKLDSSGRRYNKSQKDVFV